MLGTYDAFGVTTSNPGRFQYTGQTAITQVGLYYYKARFYNPGLGRFMQTDPIGYDDDVNLYAYVGNDPLNRADPTGTEAAFISSYSVCVMTGGSGCGAMLAPYADAGRALPLSGAAEQWDRQNYLGAIVLAGLDVGVGPETKLLGFAQKTYRAGRVPTGHAFASAREALRMFKSGDYSKVAQNKQLGTITEGKVASSLRPDVAGVRADGKIDIAEVLSPGQKADELMQKYSSALGELMGNFKALEPKRVLCTGSRIARDAC